MGTEKKIFSLTFYTAGDDLSKRWFVRIKIPDYKKGGLAWRKCYGDVNKFATKEERLQALTELAAVIESTQDYKKVKGSRKAGFVNESYHTDTVYQFKKQLEARKHRIRISTYRKYTAQIKNFEAWLIKIKKPQLPIGAFTNLDAQTFLKYLITDQGLSSQSYNQHLQLFKSFISELVDQDVVEKNIFKNIKGLEKQNKPALYFSKPQMEVLKSEIANKDTQLWQFVNFIYYAFIRPGELRQLLISDINFDEAIIRMRPEITKNKKLQYVSIPSQLMAMLKNDGFAKYPKPFYVFGRAGVPGEIPLGVNSMKVRHQTILKDLNFHTDHKLYSWKHTGAISCARAGMPLKDLQMQLRHHSLDQVNRYLASMLVWESDFIKNNYPTI